MKSDDSLTLLMKHTERRTLCGKAKPQRFESSRAKLNLDFRIKSSVGKRSLIFLLARWEYHSGVRAGEGLDASLNFEFIARLRDSRG